jgi:hypothetical protein
VAERPSEGTIGTTGRAAVQRLRREEPRYGSVARPVPTSRGDTNWLGENSSNK